LRAARRQQATRNGSGDHRRVARVGVDLCDVAVYVAKRIGDLLKNEFSGVTAVPSLDLIGIDFARAAPADHLAFVLGGDRDRFSLPRCNQFAEPVESRRAELWREDRDTPSHVP